MRRLWKRALLWLYQRQLQAAWEDAYERTLEAQRKQMAKQAQAIDDRTLSEIRRRLAEIRSRKIGETVERRKRMN